MTEAREPYVAPRVRRLEGELKAENELNANLRQQTRESDERITAINKAIAEEREANR